MPMTRAQMRHAALKDTYLAGSTKPPTRKQIKTFLDPLRKALREIMTGEVDAYRGYPVTRIHHADNNFARVDHAANGFIAMFVRLFPNDDLSPLQKLSRKLGNGVLLESKEVESCFALLKQCEDKMIQISRKDLKDAAVMEQISIELELLKLKEAA